jgi:hypothetical protein
MHRIFAFGAMILLVVALTSCTNKYQIRGLEAKTNYLINLDDLEKDAKMTCQYRKDLEARSIEKFGVVIDGKENEYSVGIVEFNDKGLVNNIQKRQVFDHLNGLMADKSKGNNGLLLVVFIHGWHHSAYVCDYNLACFRRVLLNMKKLPELADRNVVGVYLGWRGEVMDSDTTNFATIWNRKNRAEDIGKSGVKEFLLELDDLYKKIKIESYRQTAEPVTMISIGHSLGGAMLFSAAREKMVGYINDDHEEYIRSSEGLKQYISRTKPLRSGLGDLVVLLNPAIEARKWDAFDKDLRLRGNFEMDRQFPTIVAFASQADTAVGSAFPLSRWAQVLWKPWEIFSKSEIDAKGIGHYQDHITHSLSVINPIPLVETPNASYYCESDNTSKENDKRGESCGCPSNIFKGLLFNYKKFNINSNDTQEIKTLNPDQSAKMVFKNLRPDHDRYSPYMVIETDKNVMKDHNDIYNEYLISFMSAYLNDYIRKNMRTYPTQFTNKNSR